MNYLDTVLQNKDIKWKHPKMKIIEDGKVEFILTIPFTDILKEQAYRSFAAGMVALLKFFEENKDADIDEIAERLEIQMAEWKKR